MTSGLGALGPQRLDMISVSPNDPPPAPGTQIGTFGDLPGSGSYGDPISGLHSANALTRSSIEQVSRAGDAATAQAAATFQSQNAARGAAQQAQFSANMAGTAAQAQRLFAPPTITGPLLPPARGPAFDPAGPVPTPGVQDRPDPATPPARDQAAATASAPAPTASPPISPALGEAVSAGIGEALRRAAQVAGSPIGRAIPIVGQARTILDSSPAQAPGIDPRLAASPFFANGQPRVIDPGAQAADPKVAPWLQSLANGLTIPTPPDTLSPPAAYTPITGGAVAPLPGFTQAPVLSGYEGYTQIAPGVFAPLPGIGVAPAQPIGIPGLTAAGPMPALPGLQAIDPGIGGAQTLANQTATSQAIKDAIADALSSPYAGTRLEGAVGQAVLAAGIAIDGFGRSETDALGNDIGEIDLETSKYIIEITEMKNKKLPQIKKLIANTTLNPQLKKVILYAPNYGNFAAADIERAGGTVIRDLPDLIAKLGVP